MPHLHHVASGAGWFSVSLTLTIVFAAFVYLRGWLCLRSTSSNVISSWRAGSFLLGLFLIWVAVSSPIAALDHELLTVHMVQHLLLMTLAAPLIWLGAPVMPLVHGLPQQFVQGVIGPLFRWPPVQRLGRALAQPAFCWLAAFSALIGWHIPAALTLGLQSEAWHVIEQASFLVTGLLFWWPVIQPWPSVTRWPEWSILLYLFLATLPCDILSGLLVFGDRVVYSAYLSSLRPFGLSPLEDQQCAGALMWTCVTVIYLVAGTIFTARLLSVQSCRKDGRLQWESPVGAVRREDPQNLEVA
jgi:cytochrome c oxidase assembly factor CtaG